MGAIQVLPHNIPSVRAFAAFVGLTSQMQVLPALRCTPQHTSQCQCLQHDDVSLPSAVMLRVAGSSQALLQAGQMSQRHTTKEGGCETSAVVSMVIGNSGSRLTQCCLT